MKRKDKISILQKFFLIIYCPQSEYDYGKIYNKQNKTDAINITIP